MTKVKKHMERIQNPLDISIKIISVFLVPKFCPEYRDFSIFFPSVGKIKD